MCSLYVIPANRKWARDIAIAEIVLKTLEEMNRSFLLPKKDSNQLSFQIRSGCCNVACVTAVRRLTWPVGTSVYRRPLAFHYPQLLVAGSGSVSGSLMDAKGSTQRPIYRFMHFATNNFETGHTVWNLASSPISTATSSRPACVERSTCRIVRRNRLPWRHRGVGSRSCWLHCVGTGILRPEGARKCRSLARYRLHDPELSETETPELRELASWSLDQLTTADLSWLDTLPLTNEMQLPGDNNALLFHGSRIQRQRHFCADT